MKNNEFVNKIIYSKAVRLLLFFLLSLLIVLSIWLYTELNNSQKQHHMSFLAADELRQSSDDLTRMVRTYVMTGDYRYEKMYWDILAIRNGQKPRPLRYENIYWDFKAYTNEKPRSDGEKISLLKMMQNLGFTQDEFEKLACAESHSNKLVRTEMIAIHAMKGEFSDEKGEFTIKRTPDYNHARSILYDEDYHKEKVDIMTPIDEFFVMVNARTEAKVNRYMVYTSISITFVFVTIILLLVLSRVELIKRKQIESKFKENTLRLELSMQAARAGTWTWDIETGGVFWDRRMQEIFGYEPGTFGGTFEDWKQLVHPDDIDAAEESTLSLLTEDSRYDFDYRIKGKEGGWNYVNAQAEILKNANGKPIKMAGICVDITERKRIEKENEIQQKNFESIFNAAPVGMLIIDEDTNVNKVNDVMSKLVGKEDAKIIGIQPGDGLGCVHSFNDKGGCGKGEYCSQCILRNTIGSVLTSGKAVNGAETQAVFLIDDKEVELWLEVSVEPLEVEGKRCVVVLVNNITERKQAENELKVTGERLSMVLTSSNVGLWDWNIKTGSVIFDQRWAEMLGYKLEEIMQNVSTWERLLHPDDKDRVMKDLNAHFEDEKFEYRVEFRMKCKNGDWKWIFAPGKVMEREADGSPVRMTGIHIDINNSKQTEEYLHEAKQQAVTANHAKSEFLANMSHEIRTPMNGIIGFSDILADEKLTDDQMDYVKTIRSSGKNLLTIINDILDFSKIESGNLDTETIECSLGELLSSISSMSQPAAMTKGLDFEVSHKTTLPANICTDPTRVNQCLTNLASNAIKFTEKGYVHVIVSLENDEDNPMIRFDVEDTGIGIPEDKLESIFKSFSQADGSTTRKYGGTGLGLTITKQLAKIMGGSISVKSESGKGSVFSLTIPAGIDIKSQPLLGEVRMKEYTQKSSETTNTKYIGNIMVAEDCSANQKLMQLLFNKMGLQVTIVENGKQAVDAITTESYDIIFMDMQMPVLNGYEATNALREQGVTTPIIALTANAMKEDEQACLDAGCDGYLTKPINRNKLSKMMSKYLHSVPIDDGQQVANQLPSATEQQDNSPIISELANDQDFSEVIEVFLQDLPLQLQTISEAVTNADMEQLKYLIHTIKGAGGSAGFPVIMEKAAQAEKNVIEGELDSIQSSIDELTQLCKRAIANKEASSLA